MGQPVSGKQHNRLVGRNRFTIAIDLANGRSEEKPLLTPPNDEPNPCRLRLCRPPESVDGSHDVQNAQHELEACHEFDELESNVLPFELLDSVKDARPQSDPIPMNSRAEIRSVRSVHSEVFFSQQDRLHEQAGLHKSPGGPTTYIRHRSRIQCVRRLAFLASSAIILFGFVRLAERIGGSMSTEVAADVQAPIEMSTPIFGQSSYVEPNTKTSSGSQDILNKLQPLKIAASAGEPANSIPHFDYPHVRSDSRSDSTTEALIATSSESQLANAGDERVDPTIDELANQENELNDVALTPFGSLSDDEPIPTSRTVDHNSATKDEFTIGDLSAILASMSSLNDGDHVDDNLVDENQTRADLDSDDSENAKASEATSIAENSAKSNAEVDGLVDAPVESVINAVVNDHTSVEVAEAPPKLRSDDFAKSSISASDAGSNQRLVAAIDRAVEAYQDAVKLSRQSKFGEAEQNLTTELFAVTDVLDECVAKGHHELFQIALTAIDEANDFADVVTRRQPIAGGPMVTPLDLISQHKTPVLRDHAVDGMAWHELTIGYFKFAENQMVAAFQKTPDMSYLLYHLGCLQHVNHGSSAIRLARSEVFLQAAVAIDSENHLASSSLGMMKAQSGEINDASRFLEMSLAVKEDVQTRSYLEMVQSKMLQASKAPVRFGAKASSDQPR